MSSMKMAAMKLGTPLGQRLGVLLLLSSLRRR
jgi:hypothetical protein